MTKEAKTLILEAMLREAEEDLFLFQTKQRCAAEEVLILTELLHELNYDKSGGF